LRHKTSVIHPKVLTDSGIAVHKTIHRAGEVSFFSWRDAWYISKWLNRNSL
jgi:hypothetical protein